MNDVLKIQSILGYVANDNHLRASRDGKEFEGILPVPSWSEDIVKRDGTVTDTVAEMKKVIRRYAWQTAKLAPLLRGKDVYETCHNIWNFLFTHIKYKEDDEGQEQLRTPALSWAIRRSRGIDCDDFTLFAGCLLYNLNIPEYIRIARYSGKNYFQHVYPVIPLKDKQYITLDAVLDEYDAEKPTVETKDFLIMNTTNLNGIDISVLGGIEDDELNEISGILTGEDFKEVSELEGLGRFATRERELKAIHNHLLRTRGIIARRPHLIRDVEHPQSFLGMVDYALKYWDTDKRDEALGILAGEEDRVNELEGLSGYDEGHEDVELFYGLNGLGAYDVLGKAKRQRKFFSKVKQAVKKAGQGIKKIAKKLIRFNPLTVTIRAAVLLALKINLLKVSSKLKWGYLTEEEAKTRGFDMEEWRKMKSQVAKAENMFVKVLQGKAENFKRAILTGRGGKLSGTDLGYVVAAGAAATTTAAVPFITKILNLLKKINFKKLIANVSAIKMKGKTKAEESDNTTEDGESAMPEGGETSDGENTDTNSDGSETTSGNSDAGSGEGENTDENGDSNLPTATNKKMMKSASDTAQENVFTKAMNWVKENPTTSVLIGAGAAFLIYQAVKPKHALSGVRKGKKKKGKAKNNPPRTVSGTAPKKRKKSGTAKKFKL
ncbi:MAG: hypothetical protein A3F72_08905 [Bacteroidetes bacterium RIFCSPLOWO2_12_FULL_35_15]|nr:MAG: hypothetical protein A3F72_08905 [Bacteroidetes bacterium RIFCSPLOWO2_12_FULL_35_15]